MSEIKRYYFGPEGMIGQDFKIDDGLYAYVRYQDYLSIKDKMYLMLEHYDTIINKLETEVRALKAERDAQEWYPMQEIV